VVAVGLLVNLVVPHGKHFVDEILTIVLRVGLWLLKVATVRKVVQVTSDATTILQRCHNDSTMIPQQFHNDSTK
jgi:hypothetical protein